MSQTNQDTQSEDEADANLPVRGISALGSALLAWVVIAVLTVIFAALLAVDAYAAPIDPGAALVPTDRTAGLLLVGSLGGIAAVVCAVMWRDLPRQTELPRRNPDHRF